MAEYIVELEKVNKFFGENHVINDLYLNIDGKDVYLNEDMVEYPEVWAKIHEKLAEHGFILRYLEGKEDITGYSYEPWHIRYVGDPAIAKEITDAGETLEEYLGVADEARAANAAAEAEAAAAEAAGISTTVSRTTGKRLIFMKSHTVTG